MICSDISQYRTHALKSRIDRERAKRSGERRDGKGVERSGTESGERLSLYLVYLSIVGKLELLPENMVSLFPGPRQLRIEPSFIYLPAF